jgi:hypothetical protein
MVAAPLKVASLIPMIGGDDAESARNRGIPPIVIDFAPGESELTNTQLLEIQRAILAMRRDRTLACVIQHTLGSADLQLVDQRANPLSTDILSIAADLRQRKIQLQQKLISLTGQATAVMASQNPDAIQSAVDSLRTTSVQLKETEDALDQALDLLRPGADRQSQRRMKNSAILLAALRLQSVKNVLDRAPIPEVADRVRKATPLFNPAATDVPGRVTIVLTRRSKD